MPQKKPEARDDKSKKTSELPTASNSISPVKANTVTEVQPSWFLEEMEKGFNKIQTLLDHKLNTLTVSVETLLNENRALGCRVKEVEEKQANHTESLEFLHQDLADFKKQTEEEVSGLKEKLDDMENRARGQHLRLVGFPEGVEGNNVVAFLQEWLPKMLGHDTGDSI
ncbi:hypothetical protein OYC64_000096 [Pagothenia borchgrevinki]|uniref:Uncharacterized protein n=1 Tax=Pagothenia borchgrevinki TaxID=8213 RepID=A0ABD2HB32_PAGBO